MNATIPPGPEGLLEPEARLRIPVGQRLTWFQLLALAGVSVQSKLLMLSAILPNLREFSGGLLPGERLQLLRAVNHQGLTLILALCGLFGMAMRATRHRHRRLHRALPLAFGGLSFGISLYTLGAFLHWERFYTYPTWRELGLAEHGAPLMASLGDLSDHVRFSKLLVAFGIFQLTAIYLGIRSRAVLSRREILLCFAVVVGIAAWTLPAWWGTRLPLPEPLLSHPILALLDPKSRLGTRFRLEVGDGPESGTGRAPESEAPPRATGSAGTEDVPASDPPASFAPSRPRVKPNVVVLFWESCPAYAVYPWNKDRRVTPGIAALEDRLCFFDRVYANSSLSFLARFNLLFGQYCPMTVDNWGIRPVPHSLPHLFEARGYETAAIGSNNMYFSGSSQMLLQAGFDTLEFPGVLDGPYVPHAWGVDDRMIFDRARHHLARNPQGPRFLLLVSSSSHDPYQYPLPGIPEVPGAAEKPVERFRANMLFDDRLISEFASWLAQEPGQEDTLFLIVGDHGESFGQHAGRQRHGSSLYEEETHVACMLFHRGRAGLPAHVPTLGSILDLGPTLLELCGMEIPSAFQGRSLLRTTANDRVIGYLPYLSPRFSIRKGRMKLIAGLDAGDSELYDIDADPHEERNVAPAFPGTVRRLRRELASWLDAQSPVWEQWMP